MKEIPGTDKTIVGRSILERRTAISKDPGRELRQTLDKGTEHRNEGVEMKKRFGTEWNAVSLRNETQKTGLATAPARSPFTLP